MKLSRRCKRALAAAALLLAAWPAAALAEAPAALTLEDSIRLALENNRAVEQAADDREAARWSLAEARRSTGPRLSWNASASRIGGSDYDTLRRYHAMGLGSAYDKEFGNTVELSLPLYTGGELENRVRAARHALSAADLTLEYTRQDIRCRTAAAYYYILQCRNLIRVHEEAVHTLQNHLQSARDQYEIGTAAKADVLATDVQLADAKQSLITARGDYQKAVASLNNLIGRPPETELTPAGELTLEPYDAEPEACAAYALSVRPDALAAEYAARRARANVKAARAGFLPQVRAGVSKSVAGEKPFDDDHNASWSVGLNVAWNVFDNGVTEAGAKQAEYALRRALSEAAETRERVRLEVYHACTDLLSAARNADVTRRAVGEAEAQYEIAQIRYDEGVDTNLAVMDAQEKLTEARTNYYTALYQYNLGRAQLEKAMGVPVGIDARRYDDARRSGRSETEALSDAAVPERTADGPLP